MTQEHPKSSHFIAFPSHTLDSSELKQDIKISDLGDSKMEVRTANPGTKAAGNLALTDQTPFPREPTGTAWEAFSAPRFSRQPFPRLRGVTQCEVYFLSLVQQLSAWRFELD